MLLILSRILSRSSCILILIMFDLAISAPYKSRKRSPSENERGFSASPRILEIQLPLKIASKQDLVAWSKYVMSLVTSKVNSTATSLRNSIIGVSSADNSITKSKEMMMKKAPFGDKRQGLNYPARRLQAPPMRRGDEQVMAYPLPLGGTKTVPTSPQNPFNLPTLDINGSPDFANFNANFQNYENLFSQSELDTFGNFDILGQQAYLPLRTSDIAVYQNISGLKSPGKLETAKTPLNVLKAFDNELGQTLPIAHELTATNLSHLGEPLLTFPFQAVITINSQIPGATTILNTQPKDYFGFHPRDSFHEFSQFEKDFEKNYTLTNESGQVDVIFNDLGTNTNGKKSNKNVKKEEEKEDEEEEEERGKQKKKSEKKMKNAKAQKRQQSAVLGDLLRMLGILRKLPKNTTEINVGTPVLSILKGTNSQKIQVTFDETPPNQEGNNETSSQQAQELNDDDDDDDDEEEEEEEEGGSIQAIIDLLPLAAPLLEDLSDPNSETDIAEVLQAAIPLLEELSDPNEEGGIDIPGILLPLSQRLSEGPEGQGSDSGAILGPILQLIAPLIGSLSAPLIGPLSRSSSGPEGKQNSGAIISQVAGPLSEPQGPHGQTIFSNLVAGITARLSKELAASAGDSDVKSLVSSLVSGVLAGTSAGSSAGSGSQKGSYGQRYGVRKDTYYAPTTYGSYGNTDSYQPQAPAEGNDMFNAILKEVLGAFLKLSATSSTSSANLSGTSSSGSAGLSASSSQGSSQEPPKTPAYGPPTNEGYEPMRPAYASPPANSAYETFSRRRGRQQIKKF